MHPSYEEITRCRVRIEIVRKNALYTEIAARPEYPPPPPEMVAAAIAEQCWRDGAFRFSTVYASVPSVLGTWNGQPAAELVLYRDRDTGADAHFRFSDIDWHALIDGDGI